MTKVRQDAWSHEDDLLLAETVLRHIREGSTQLDAFEEVGDRLNRTGAACGFRWNAIVRRKYEQAIEIAKKQRKQKKRAEQRRYAARATASELPAMETASMPSADGTGKDTHDSTQRHLPVAESGPSTSPDLTIPEVIRFLQTIQEDGTAGSRMTQENARLKEENEQLRQENDELKHKVEELNSHQQTVENDYQALIGIMDRARRMAALKDQDEEQAPAFKLDENGNLEKIAK